MRFGAGRPKGADRCLGVTFTNLNEPSRSHRQSLVTLALSTLFRAFMRGREATGNDLREGVS